MKPSSLMCTIVTEYLQGQEGLRLQGNANNPEELEKALENAASAMRMLMVASDKLRKRKSA